LKLFLLFSQRATNFRRTPLHDGQGQLSNDRRTGDASGERFIDMSFECRLFRNDTDVGVKTKESFARRTVNISPPLTSESFLIEQRSVRAQERVGDLTTFRSSRANVENLTPGLDISIITVKASIARKTSDRDGFQNRIVDLGQAGDGFLVVPQKMLFHGLGHHGGGDNSSGFRHR